MAVDREDAAAARDLYELLEPEQQGMAVSGIMYYQRLLGLLAHTTGNLDDARTHFEDALAFCRRAGYRPELAWTCHDYAALRHAQGDHQRAMLLLAESLAISTELGMRPLMERAAALQERAASLPPRLTSIQPA